MKLKTSLMVVAVLALSACSGRNAALLEGPPPVTNNTTPYGSALSCLSPYLPKGRQLTVAIDQIADKTGKVNLSSEGTGYWVTQGAGDILSSALFGKVKLVERLNPHILEWELDLANKKVLGDGHSTTVINGDGKTETVPYRQIKLGGLRGSDFYITGSINSLDFSVVSGGGEIGVSGYAPRARWYRMLVGLNIRAVNTRTGEVVADFGIHKQIAGEEVGLNIGRFFGSHLVALDVGYKRDEPLQFALRSMLELAAFDLLEQLYGTHVPQCEAMFKSLEGVSDVQKTAQVVDKDADKPRTNFNK